MGTYSFTPPLKREHWILSVVRWFRKLSYQLAYQGYSDPAKHVKWLVDNTVSRGIVLDIGAGNGQHWHQLRRLGDYISVDPYTNAHTQASVYDLPYGSNSVDVAAMFMVLEHLEDPLLALDEAWEILKPGGTLLITVPQYWHFHSHPSDYFRYTHKGLELLLHDAGFMVQTMRSMGGPFLVLAAVIDVNLRLFGGSLRRLFLYTPLMLICNALDWLFFRHNDQRKESDSLGWAVIARKMC